MSPVTVLRGSRCVLPTGLTEADVAWRDGRIVAIGAPGTIAGDEAVEAAGLLTLPGAVDMHVHFRDPGFIHKEDFLHGTAAAACGGVTVVCDMPNTHPPVTSADELAAKSEAVADRAHVDFGLWAGGARTDEFSKMADLGAVGLKIYMVRPGHPDDPYAQELSILDDAELLEVFTRSADVGWLVSVHVTNPDLEETRRSTLQAAGRNDPWAYYEALGGIGALEALRRVVLFAQEVGAKLHIAHLSLTSVACLDELRRLRRSGVSVSSETVPPVLGTEALGRLGTRALPHVLDDNEQEHYWRGLVDGTIDAIATDHAPHQADEKARGDADVWQAPPGYPGIETSLPLMLDAALRGSLTLERLVEVMATAPARLLSLGGKGVIAPGYDADLVVVNVDDESVVDERRLHSKAGWSPFHGRRLRGRLVQTFLRGHLIAQEGELTDTPGLGQQIRPTTPILRRVGAQ